MWFVAYNYFQIHFLMNIYFELSIVAQKNYITQITTYEPALYF